jgi:tetratricopeptide (TPR) repeat protein
VRKIVTTVIALALGPTIAMANTAADCSQSDNLDLSIKACTELNAYSDKKDYPAAIANYGKALELRPDNAGIYYNRGRAYRTGSLTSRWRATTRRSSSTPKTPMR